MFPEKSGRARALRARGLAQVHDARRPDRDVRLLDRLVGRARVQRALHRADRPGRVVPGRAVRRARRTTPRSTGYFSTGTVEGRPAAADRHRADPRRLALQLPRRTRRRDVRLPRRRAAHGPALRDDDPAVPERRLRQREPDIHDQGDRRPAWGRDSSSRSSWLMADGWSAWGVDVCATFAPEYKDTVTRHEAGAALGRAVLARRLHPAPDRLRRRWRRGAGRGVRLRRRDGQARRLDGLDELLRGLSRRELRHLDEHGDRGRRARALRDLARRDDRSSSSAR